MRIDAAASRARAPRRGHGLPGPARAPHQPGRARHSRRHVAGQVRGRARRRLPQHRHQEERGQRGGESKFARRRDRYAGRRIAASSLRRWGANFGQTSIEFGAGSAEFGLNSTDLGANSPRSRRIILTPPLGGLRASSANLGMKWSQFGRSRLDLDWVRPSFGEFARIWT